MLLKAAKYYGQAFCAVFNYRLVPLGRLAATEGVFPSLQHLVADKHGIIIFDVGAHRGETAIELRKWFPAAYIYSFEPFKESYNLLKQAVAADPGIEALNFGLGEKSEAKILHSNALAATNSLLPTNSAAAKIYEPGMFETRETVQAEFKTVDDFAKERSISYIDILKLDVQGAEHLVMEGAQELIRNKGIGLIVAEVTVRETYRGQLNLVEALSVYYNAGFALYNIYSCVLARDGSLKQFDAIFVRRDIAE